MATQNRFGLGDIVGCLDDVIYHEGTLDGAEFASRVLRAVDIAIRDSVMGYEFAGDPMVVRKRLSEFIRTEWSALVLRENWPDDFAAPPNLMQLRFDERRAKAVVDRAAKEHAEEIDRAGSDIMAQDYGLQYEAPGTLEARALRADLEHIRPAFERLKDWIKSRVQKTSGKYPDIRFDSEEYQWYLDGKTVGKNYSRAARNLKRFRAISKLFGGSNSWKDFDVNMPGELNNVRRALPKEIQAYVSVSSTAGGFIWLTREEVERNN